MTRGGWRTVVVAGLAAATAAHADPAPGELWVGVRHLPASVDPATAGGPHDAMVFRHLYEGLVEFGERGDVEPSLATHWSVSRDGLTWSFRLRPDVRFSNGASLTPDVVAASLARHLAPEEPPPEAPAWSRLFQGPSALVREVRRGDGGTVQIHLGQPFSPLLALLTHPALAVVVPQNGSEVPFLGTGPYRVVERRPGRLVLEADVGPHGQPTGASRLIFLQMADDAAGLAGLGPRGGLDVYLPLAPPAWAGIGLQVLSAPTWQMGLLALRATPGALDKKAARQAVAHSLDPALLRAALGRWATPLAAYLPPGAWGAYAVAPLPYDPARARRLFGRPGPGPLTLLAPEAPAGPDALRLAEAIRVALAVAGVKVEVQTESPEAYLPALRQGDGQLALFETTVEVNDPHFTFRSLVASDAATPGSATNVAFYRSPLVDSLLGRGSQVAFRPERLRLYQRLQAHLAEELPYIPLYVRLQWAVARPTVRDLRLDPAGRHRLDRVWIDASADAGPGAPAGSPRPGRSP